MLQHLKDSSFAVNDVLVRSWQLMRSRYFTIVGLNIVLVIVSLVSAVVSGFLRDINLFLSLFLALAFVVAYFGTQMTLYKFILKVLDHEEHIVWKEAIPSALELNRLFIGMLIVVAAVFGLYLILSVLVWPFIYLVGIDTIMEINVILFPVILLFFMIRIVFFPFFILDQNRKTWESIRFSFALTRGNVFRLILLLVFFLFINSLVILITYIGYAWLSVILTIISFLVVVPWISVAMTVAYRDMVNLTAGHVES